MSDLHSGGILDAGATRNPTRCPCAAYIKDGGRLAFPSRVRWLPVNHPLIN